MKLITFKFRSFIRLATEFLNRPESGSGITSKFIGLI
jgi:hypothetical protein